MLLKSITCLLSTTDVIPGLLHSFQVMAHLPVQPISHHEINLLKHPNCPIASLLRNSKNSLSHMG